VNYASSKSGADKVVDEIVKAGGKAVAVQGDVSQLADVQRIFAETRKAYGRLDVLVNNAGIYEFAPLADITEAHFHKQFDTNVLGLLMATQEAVKLFDAQGGSIINIGSTASALNPPATAVYTATKSAVNAVTHVLAKELGPKRFA
jgi:3-oxoacyl-[acyl-carrier protein] reductase